MTPRERAEKAARNIPLGGREPYYIVVDHIESAISEAVAEERANGDRRVAAEREACARMLETHHYVYDMDEPHHRIVPNDKHEKPDKMHLAWAAAIRVRKP